MRCSCYSGLTSIAKCKLPLILRSSAPLTVFHIVYLAEPFPSGIQGLLAHSFITLAGPGPVKTGFVNEPQTHFYQYLEILRCATVKISRRIMVRKFESHFEIVSVLDYPWLSALMYPSSP